MSLSQPNNPSFINNVAKSVFSGSIFASLVSRTQVNQIKGVTQNNTTGAGIPKQVNNVQVSVANAQAGSTCTVTVLFRQDATDKAFSGVNVWVRGYQGNGQLVQVASGTQSPCKFTLNNTGETVSFTIQAFGNGGNAPLSQSPTASGVLPKSTTGGFGSSTVTGYSVSNPPPSSGLTLNTSGKGWFLAAGSKDHSPVINSFNAALTNRAANVLVVSQFVLSETWTLSKVSYALQTAVAASNFNFGIYDSSGNKLIDSGAFDGSITTAQTKSFTAVTLPPGVYYFVVSETTGGSLQGPIIQMPAATLAKWLGYFTATTAFVGTAANATSGNVLPATLGTITAATAAWFQGLPLCAWQV